MREILFSFWGAYLQAFFSQVFRREVLILIAAVLTASALSVFIARRYYLRKGTPIIEIPNNSDPQKEIPAEAQMTDLFSVLAEMGINDCTSKLSESKYEPLQCMAAANKRLYFMGILAAKWVFPHMAEFDRFLKKIQLQGGNVTFLLINPKGQAYPKLRDMRDGALSTTSLPKLTDLVTKYSCFKVYLYDHIPCFRLVFIDDKEVAVSRYKIDSQGYFKSKSGWEAPHLIIKPGTNWSLYEPFEQYFHDVKSSSVSLEEIMNKERK